MVITLLILTLARQQTSDARQHGWIEKVSTALDGSRRKDFHWSSKTNAVWRAPSQNANPAWYIFDGATMRLMNREEIAAHESWTARSSSILAQSRELLRRTEARQARLQLEAILIEDDMSYAASLLLAEVAAFEGNFDESILLAEPFVQDATVRPRLVFAYAAASKGLVFQGMEQFCSQQIRQSMTGLLSDEEKLAGNARGLAALALANEYDGTSHDELALAYFYKVTELEPNNPIANFNIGQILERRGLLSTALEKYELTAKHSSDRLASAAERWAKSLRKRMSRRSVTTGGTTGA